MDEIKCWARFTSIIIIFYYVLITILNTSFSCLSNKAPFIFGPNQQGKIEWVGYSDVYTMKICSQYVIHMKLGGVSIWAIENDDFSGSYCKQGMYPLLTTLNEELLTVKNKSVENNTSIINSVPETSPKYLKPNKKSPIVQNAISR